MSIVIRPTEAELHLAASVGVLRTIFAVRNNLKRGKNNHEDAGSADNVTGAIGEMMVAKHLDYFWSGTIGTVKAVADVGPCFQVRATDHPHGKLIAYPEDNDRQPYILARVLLPDVHLVGWLWGAEAKQKQFWRTDVRSPAFFAWPVHDMDELPSEAAVALAQQKVVA